MTCNGSLGLSSIGVLNKIVEPLPKWRHPQGGEAARVWVVAATLLGVAARVAWVPARGAWQPLGLAEVKKKLGSDYHVSGDGSPQNWMNALCHGGYNI
jgi:hypothetical protein